MHVPNTETWEGKRMKMARIDFLRRTLIAFLVGQMLAVLFGCRSTRYVSAPERHVEHIVNTDTFAVLDSVFLTDSVYVCQKGDTVYSKKVSFRDRWRYIYKVRLDTVIVRDSVSVPCPVERQLTKFEKLQTSAGWCLAVFLITATVTVSLTVWWYHNKKC